MPPPIATEPILVFLVDPMKVAGFEIYGVNSTDIGDIKGEAMGGQKGYRRTGFPSKGWPSSDIPST
jgi:hypothetical protein